MKKVQDYANVQWQNSQNIMLVTSRMQDQKMIEHAFGLNLLV